MSRTYRQADKAELKDYTITGYATTWDKYKLFENEYVDYFEQISKKAFENADMSDVILQFNHSSSVFARQSNGTLQLEVDDVGLKVTADLSKTTKSRQMYEDVKERMITEMSWAFTVDSDSYNSETRTRHIDRVRKVFDVSLVDRGANNFTSVTARSAKDAREFFEGAIESQKRSDLKLSKAQTEYL